MALIIEQSDDLLSWRITNLPARVTQYNDCTDDISLTIPTPVNSATAPAKRFFRVHMVIPDQVNP